VWQGLWDIDPFFRIKDYLGGMLSQTVAMPSHASGPALTRHRETEPHTLRSSTLCIPSSKLSSFTIVAGVLASEGLTW
jgi:hypothetical protein